MGKEIPLDELNRLFYLADDGRIFNRIRRGRISAGTEAGSYDGGRYRQIEINGRSFKAHRIAFALATGTWPKWQVDHIDGDGLNNRISNLRDVPPVVNSQNRKKNIKKGTKSGLLGVFQNRNRWMAKIQHDHKDIYLGTFNTKEEAHRKYLEAKRQLHAGCTI